MASFGGSFQNLVHMNFDAAKRFLLHPRFLLLLRMFFIRGQRFGIDVPNFIYAPSLDLSGAAQLTHIIFCVAENPLGFFERNKFSASIRGALYFLDFWHPSLYGRRVAHRVARVDNYFGYTPDDSGVGPNIRAWLDGGAEKRRIYINLYKRFVSLDYCLF